MRNRFRIFTPVILSEGRGEPVPSRVEGPCARPEGARAARSWAELAILEQAVRVSRGTRPGLPPLVT